MTTHKSLLKYILNTRFCDREEINLSEIYDEAEWVFWAKGRNSTNIRSTIRKNLQALRDDGTITFAEGRRGVYKLRPCLDRTWSSEATIGETDCDPITRELVRVKDDSPPKKVHFGDVETRVYAVDHDQAMKRHRRWNKPKSVVAPGFGIW